MVESRHRGPRYRIGPLVPSPISCSSFDCGASSPIPHSVNSFFAALALFIFALLSFLQTYIGSILRRPLRYPRTRTLWLQAVSSPYFFLCFSIFLCYLISSFNKAFNRAIRASCRRGGLKHGWNGSLPQLQRLKEWSILSFRCMFQHLRHACSTKVFDFSY